MNNNNHRVHEYDDDFDCDEPWKLDPMDIFGIVIVAFVLAALAWGLCQI